MTMGLVVLMALVLVVSFLIVLAKTLGLARVLRHTGKVDVAFTIIACILLAGSVTGLLIGILSGLFMTVVLSGMEWVKRATQVVTGLTKAEKPNPHDDGWAPIRGWYEP